MVGWIDIREIRCHNSRTSRMPSSTRSMRRSSRRPTLSSRKILSRVTICETFTTESLGSPDSPALRRRFPGAASRERFEVRATAMTVFIRLRLKSSEERTTTGRRYPGSEAVGRGSRAHHTSPRRHPPATTPPRAKTEFASPKARGRDRPAPPRKPRSISR